MAEHEFKSVKPAVQHVPDFSIETNADGSKSQVELPGKVLLGFQVDGVFVPLLERKAAGLLADIERAKSTTASG